MEDKEAKTVFEEKATCPDCKAKLILRKVRTCLQPGIAAKYNDVVIVERDSQTKLVK